MPHCVTYDMVRTITTLLFCLAAFGNLPGQASDYTLQNSASDQILPTVLPDSGIPGNAILEDKKMDLALPDAISMALEYNLDLQIQRFNPLLDGFRLQDALAGWIPSLRGDLTIRDDSNPGGINPATNEPFPSNKTESTFIRPSIEGLLPTGTSYTVGFDTVERTGEFIPVDRQHTGNVSFWMRQPLLKDLWIDDTRRFMRVSRKNLEVSYAQLEFTMMQILRNVEHAYYDLIASRENLKVQEKALELGLQTLRENRKRVEVGVMAPLDETEAEAQVATSRADLIRARQELRSRQNALKRLITNDFARFYEIELIPTESLETREFDFDVYASWSHGLVKRPELVEARINIDRQDIVIKYQKNQLFPQIDLIASYSVNGVDAGYGGLWDDFRGRNDPSTSIGIRFDIPLHNQALRNRYKVAKAEKELLIVQLQNLEQQIQSQIAEAVDLARSAKEQVIASSEARRFAEKALEVEQVKLANGKSTSFIVLRLQRDLTQRSADEISARANYRRSMTTLSFNEGTILERNGVLIDATQFDRP